MREVRFSEILPILRLRPGGPDRADLLLDLVQKRGPRLRFDFLGKSIFIFADGASVRDALVKHGSFLAKSPDYRILSELTGNSLLTSNGNDWKNHRQDTKHLFTSQAFDALEPHLQASVDQSVRSLFAGESVLATLEKMAFSIVNQLCLGVPTLDAWPDVNRALHHAQNHVVTRGFSLLDWRKWIFNPADRLFRRLNTKMRTSVRQMRDEHLSVESRAVFSGARGLDHLITLYLAGHETSAVAISWMLIELARNPEIQERVRQDRELVDAFLFETLRLWPPVAFMGRQATQEFELQGTRIRRGSIFVFSPFVIHRYEGNFERPLEFDLDRWKDKAPSQVPGYLPFSLGGRSCIGARLAHQEMSLFLNRLLDEGQVRSGIGSGDRLPKNVGLTMKPRPEALSSLRFSR